MVMLKKNRKIALLFCMVLGLSLSGCAANSVGALSKSGNYGNRSERRLMTMDGKKAEEAMNTAEEYERLGDMNLQKGDMTASFVNYSRALRMEPERLSVSYKMGRLFLLKGMTNEARGEFEKIIKKDPKNALAHEGMGRAYLLDNKNERAVECLARAARVQDTNDRRWEVHDLMGIAYDRQKKYSFAIEEAFTTAIEKGEDGSRVYNNLAVTLTKLGDHRMARAAFNRAGSEATAQNNIGYLYLLDGKNKEAATAFEKAIELEPAFYGKAHDNLHSAKDALQE